MSLVVLGDSHALFSFAGVSGARIHWQTGATMHRAARDGIRSLLPRFPFLTRRDTLVLVYGEVDCRAHIPRLAIKNNRSPIEEADALLDRYALAVSEFWTRANVALCCVPPFNPTFEDYEGSREIRAHVNGRLASFGLPFIDFRQAVITPDGSMSNAFTDNNVHIHPQKAQPVVDAVNRALGLGVSFAEPPYPPNSRAYQSPWKRFRRQVRAVLMPKLWQPNASSLP